MLSQNEPLNLFLIVGLGNPGEAYDESRHNIGFQAVRRFATRHGLRFRSERQLSGEWAQGEIEGAKVLLLLPMTYMNSSGESVRRCVNYFKPATDRVMVVSDDVALPVETLRMREGGSAGGHKGLLSIESHLGTQKYPRLRIGVGDKFSGSLEDHVLSRFSADEKKRLDPVLDKAVDVLETWIKKGIKAAMTMANTKGEE